MLRDRMPEDRDATDQYPDLLRSTAGYLPMAIGKDRRIAVINHDLYRQIAQINIPFVSLAGLRV